MLDKKQNNFKKQELTISKENKTSKKVSLN